ncbi:hypothetical protein Tco_0307611 [Tanacetum coccineum]
MRFILHVNVSNVNLKTKNDQDMILRLLVYLVIGDSESVKVIKESLDEFSGYSGLLPSMQKSTVFFRGLSSAEQNILKIIPFTVEKLPVRMNWFGIERMIGWIIVVIDDRHNGPFIVIETMSFKRKIEQCSNKEKIEVWYNILGYIAFQFHDPLLFPHSLNELITFLSCDKEVLLTLFPNDQYPTIEMRYDATIPFHMGLDDERLGVDRIDNPAQGSHLPPLWGSWALEKELSRGSINDESNYTTKVLWDYALETAACILNMVPTKKTKVLFARKSEFFENDLIDLKASGSVEDLELIQEEDTNPYVDTSLNHEEDDQEIDEPFM